MAGESIRPSDAERIKSSRHPTSIEIKKTSKIAREKKDQTAKIHGKNRFQ